jgi:hypothetical protein
MSNIPVILCNRDRLTTTRQLVEDLYGRGYDNIYILDMVSTYPPLLDWYKDQKIAEIIYMKHNIGHMALWNSDLMTNKFKDYPFVVYSDSDIQLNKDTPPLFIETMVKVCKDYKMDKVGLAINITDLPDTPINAKIGPIESQYWQNKIPSMEHELYLSNVDTTFCVVRVGKPFTYRAIRIAGNFTCNHLPWYVDYNNLNEEEQYVYNNADSKFSSYKTLLK